MGLGQVADRIQHRTPEEVFAEFDLGDLAGETRFPFRLHLEQSLITPVMLARLRALPNAEVRFGAGVAEVEASAAGVVAVWRDGQRAQRKVFARGGRGA